MTTSQPDTRWTPDQLSRIDAADELDIASIRRDGSPGSSRTIWVVRLEDDLYVRSVNGSDSDWYRLTREREQGHVEAGGVDQDVTYVDTHDGIDVSLNDRIDEAYRIKYRHYSASPVERITSDDARATTIKLVPR